MVWDRRETDGQDVDVVDNVALPNSHGVRELDLLSTEHVAQHMAVEVARGGEPPLARARADEAGLGDAVRKEGDIVQGSKIADGDLELDVWAPVVDVPWVEPTLGEDALHTEIVARYLVVSRGELLMVRRYRVQHAFTTSFRVYRLELVQLQVG